MTNSLQDLEAVKAVRAVSEMELHQVATGETLPGYHMARRDAENKAWMLVRAIAYGDAAELEGLAEDAERYRWLRDSVDAGPAVFSTDASGAAQQWLNDEQLDAAIDAALSAAKERGT